MGYTLTMKWVLVVFFILGFIVAAYRLFLGDRRERSDRVLQIIRGEEMIAEYVVDIADTPAERARGLMYREKLEADQGMLFIFPRQRNHSFWMKNTKVGLDIVFADENWEIVGIIENTTPESTKPLTIDKPSKYILEIGAGSVKRKGITEGDKLKIQSAK